MMNINCPCEECICVPICRHKKFDEIVTDCFLIFQYLYVRLGVRRQSFSKYIGNTKKHLDPTLWYIVFDRSDTPVVLHYAGISLIGD